MVADRETDEPFGVVGIYHPLDWPEPEIGWSLYANAEGRGIGYEAALALAKRKAEIEAQKTAQQDGADEPRAGTGA